MISWLRSLLRRWLLDEPRVTTLECWIDGEMKRVSVTGAVGMHLKVFDGRNTSLISPNSNGVRPVCQEAFWEAWRDHQNAKYEWEDGTRFTGPD